MTVRAKVDAPTPLDGASLERKDVALRTSERIGHWLFRWRSYLPVPLLVVALLGIWTHARALGSSGRPNELWDALCVSLSLLGLGVRVATVGFVPGGTSGRNTREQRADSINTEGIYSVVRHPLYLANFLMWLGVALFTRTWWVTFVCVAVFWVAYRWIMLAEEGYLRNKFADEYSVWANATPAFVPRFHGWKRSRLPFSTRSVLRREYSGFFGIVVTFSLFAVARDSLQRGQLHLERDWGVFLALGFVVWVVLRTLKKKTRLLSMEGR